MSRVPPTISLLTCGIYSRTAKPWAGRFSFEILISLAVGLVLGGILSELAFHFQVNTTGRPPETIDLVIPPGTSQQVSQGTSDVPQDMVIVVGDTLLVHNQDLVAHTLGPLFIPAGSSASLTLNHVGNIAYTCSFEPTKYFGLDVQGALTIWIRLEGVSIAGVPMGALLGLYSLILWPLKKSQPTPAVTK